MLWRVSMKTERGFTTRRKQRNCNKRFQINASQTYCKYSVTVLSFKWGIYIGRKPTSQCMLVQRQFPNNTTSYRWFAVLDEALHSLSKHSPTANAEQNRPSQERRRTMSSHVSCSHTKLKTRVSFLNRYATNWTPCKLSIVETYLNTSHIRNEQNKNKEAYCSLLLTAEMKLLEDFEQRFTGRWD